MTRQSLTPTRCSADVLSPEELLRQQRQHDDVLPQTSRNRTASRPPAAKSSQPIQADVTCRVPYADVAEDDYEEDDYEEEETAIHTDDFSAGVSQSGVRSHTTRKTTGNFLQPSQQPSLGERVAACRQSLQAAGSHMLFWMKAAGWVVAVGCVAYIGINTYFWSIDQWNTYHYGPTRTSHITAVLGLDHDSALSPSDVIVTNVRGNILLTIVPAGDATKTQVYDTGCHLVGDGVSRTPAIATVGSVNGHVSLSVHIDGQPSSSVFINAGDHFSLEKQ